MKNRSISSMKKFLQVVKKQKIQKYHDKNDSEYSNPTFEKYGESYYIIIDMSLYNYVLEAINSNYIKGIQILVSDDGRNLLEITKPILTSQGEDYLLSQTYFAKHPHLEKLSIAAFSLILSGLLQLLLN